MSIRPAIPGGDASDILDMILPVIRDGETYALDRDMEPAQALAYWNEPGKETFVTEEDGVILGTYYLRPNQAGGGKHVATAAT
jgi:hypothetical protein